MKTKKEFIDVLPKVGEVYRFIGEEFTGKYQHWVCLNVWGYLTQSDKLHVVAEYGYMGTKGIFRKRRANHLFKKYSELSQLVPLETCTDKPYYHEGWLHPEPIGRYKLEFMDEEEYESMMDEILFNVEWYRSKRYDIRGARIFNDRDELLSFMEYEWEL